MKIKQKSIAVLAIAVMLITSYSCRKEVVSVREIEPEAKWAKDYFNNILLPSQGNEVSYSIVNKISSTDRIGKKANLKTPLWSRAKADKSQLYSYVEVPLSYSRKIVSIIAKKDEPVDKAVIKASFNRLIIFKDKKGKINQRIISFIPNKAYLDRHNGDISHNKINALDNDFDGYLIYKTWDDKIVSRLRVINGKASTIKKSVNKPSIKLNKLASIDRSIASRPGYEGEPGCIDFFDVSWEIVCYYTADNPVPDYCDEPVMISKEWVSTECPDDGPNPGGCEDPMNFSNPECQENPGGEIDNNIPSIGAASSEDLITEMLVDLDTFKVAFKTWKYWDGYTYFFSSQERLAIKVEGATRTWDSFTHIGKSGEGGYVAGTVEVAEFKPTMHMDYNPAHDSFVDIDFRLKVTVGGTLGTVGISLPPYTTAKFNSVAIFDLYFNKK